MVLTARLTNSYKLPSVFFVQTGPHLVFETSSLTG